MPTFSLTEVQKHSSSTSCWVIYHGAVYDVTTFLADHPGGEDFILDHAGKDISSLMEGPDHNHSDSAYQVLAGFKIGTLAQPNGASGEATLVKRKVAAAARAEPESDDTQMYKENGWSAELIQDSLGKASADFIDPHKPMLAQIWRSRWTKAFYLEQVHIPKHVPFAAPIFGYDHILEPLSKTSWWVVPLVWLPVGQLAIGGWAFRRLPLAAFAAYYGFGVGMWTFIEYSLHRWLFHVERFLPESQMAFLLHFLTHGVHHFLPMDGMRLVMPPALFCILLAPVYLTLVPWFPSFETAHATLAGALLGYVCYDLIHYYLHHGRVITAHLRAMKTWHMDHHYKNANTLYGITSKFWDYVFGTTK
ncbi:Inositolphosphorylceramide-B hydroxylase [Gonapodya prolifera JEL478]|uniref:Ceramide very long chain fatty acid hydroxylase n=1 Tax=Gonapodya prolifera (strain JEL478) TaxID=1344416 RepID=A0A139AC09_GONPJ|nr:Inositolphosphorylceramide-B hydroxylase [Gonapodya prolifera JEL478]|eukprot:KXS14297.1 Inositolphosphorylceramide-B hydroxylase [Gonapodya prolifera JEL478]